MDFDRTQSVNQLIKALEGVIRERAADELSRGGSAEQGMVAQAIAAVTPHEYMDARLVCLLLCLVE